jgi:hypothetical protein
MTFPDGVLARDSSVKGFTVVGTDGRAGRVSWASYKPGESYLVVTTGLLRKAHHMVPAGLVTSVANREVRVDMTRARIAQLPDLPHPDAPVLDSESSEQMLNAFERAYSLTQRS